MGDTSLDDAERTMVPVTSNDGDPPMNKSLQKSIINFLAEEDGATAVEYAIVLGLIGAACIASVNFLAARTNDSFDTSRLAIEAAN